MIHIVILTPKEKLLDADVESVSMPGSMSPFTVFEHHAPIISSLEKGVIRCRMAEGTKEFQVDGGFVEVRDNVISVCLE